MMNSIFIVRKLNIPQHVHLYVLLLCWPSRCHSGDGAGDLPMVVGSTWAFSPGFFPRLIAPTVYVKSPKISLVGDIFLSKCCHGMFALFVFFYCDSMTFSTHMRLYI